MSENPDSISREAIDLPASKPRSKRRLLAFASLFAGQGAREGYLAAVDQAVISLSNFLGTIILARQVSPTELGVYGVGFIAINLARALQEGLVVQPLNVFGAPMDDSAFRRYASSSAVLQILLAAALALLASSGGWLLTVTGNDTAGPAVFALWFAILGWQLQEFCRRVLYTRGRVANAVFNSILANTVRLGLLVFLGVQGRLSGVNALLAIGWGSFFALVPGVWATRRYWTGDIHSLGYTFKNNWAFGRWVLGGSVASWISVEFYPILTAGMISFAAAGAYRALQNLVAPIHLLLRAIDTFFTPRAARLYGQAGSSGVGRMLRLIYMATAIPMLGILGVAILFREQLLHLLYGDTYLEYSPGIVLMVVFYALLYAYGPLQSAFKAMRISRPIFTANLVAAIAMFTFGVLAINRWGVYGTLSGQVLNALLVNLVLWVSWARMKRVG
jgi:O-antigen/teichoic acid export membrane protein